MKMSKVWVVGLLAGILVFSGSFLCQAAEDKPMSNVQFASMLADVLGLGMPENAEELSDAELFEVQANMLAERGITLFVDAKPDKQVTNCDLANVLYDALIGPNDATIKEKFDYLANLGYLAVSPGYKCDVMGSSEITATLNIPELSRAVVEGYSPPAVGLLGAAGAGIAPAPHNPESESFVAAATDIIQ